ncbi:hypothetical protein JTE90_014340 [Oedothorax gibbosus]|uniref:Reverse transcriptase domain-containing protein n=1 Tax=Oedothorax gibbosus TaxID=931172 RepID=A0AAV6TSI8_9ARAC|nr:hypothetical protein JTE90_014340 [Oedothorax gibbosus]
MAEFNYPFDDVLLCRQAFERLNRQLGVQCSREFTDPDPTKLIKKVRGHRTKVHPSYPKSETFTCRRCQESFRGDGSFRDVRRHDLTCPRSPRPQLFGAGPSADASSVTSGLPLDPSQSTSPAPLLPRTTGWSPADAGPAAGPQGTIPHPIDQASDVTAAGSPSLSLPPPDDQPLDLTALHDADSIRVPPASSDSPPDLLSQPILLERRVSQLLDGEYHVVTSRRCADDRLGYLCQCGILYPSVVNVLACCTGDHRSPPASRSLQHDSPIPDAGGPALRSSMPPPLARNIFDELSEAIANGESADLLPTGDLSCLTCPQSDAAPALRVAPCPSPGHPLAASPQLLIPTASASFLRSTVDPGASDPGPSTPHPGVIQRTDQPSPLLTLASGPTDAALPPTRPDLNATFIIELPSDLERPDIDRATATIPPLPPDPLDPRLSYLEGYKLSAFQRFWTLRFADVDDPVELDKATQEFSEALLCPPKRRRTGRRSGRRRPTRNTRYRKDLDVDGITNPRDFKPFFNDFGLPFSREEACNLQQDFYSRPGKTMGEIISGSPELCDLPGDDLVKYFTDIYAPKTYDPQFQFASFPVPDPASQEALVRPFDPAEVWAKLKKAPKTAPGPDLVPFSTLKSRDPNGLILCVLFRRILQFGGVPDAFRKANIVLAFKAGERSDISNWKPIALLNTVGKIFSSCFATRLNSWSELNARTSPYQKGFKESDGCLDHNFVVKQLIARARNSGSSLFLAWMDLENAFGAIPHDLIFEGLRRAGLPDLCIGLIRSLYTNARSELPPVSLKPSLCKLVYVRLCGRQVKILAYADDLLLVAPDAATLQKGLTRLEKAAALASFRFKPRKCATLSISKRHPAGLAFYIYGQSLPLLSNDAAYKYLGVKVGFSAKQDYTATIKEVRSAVLEVQNSLLAPWQMLAAIKCHILPRLDHLLRNLALQKQDISELDSVIRQVGKSILNLPQRGHPNSVYIPTAKGGAGLPSISDLVDIHAVNYAFKVLSSSDSFVRELATSTLKVQVQSKVHRPPDVTDMAAYLTGTLQIDTKAAGTATLWSLARSAAIRLRKKFDLAWSWCEATAQFCLSLGLDEKQVIIPQSVAPRLFHCLCDFTDLSYVKPLSQKVEQGRSCPLISKHTSSNDFIRTGEGIRFCDWRFIHRARTGILSLNCIRRHRGGNTRCRKCGYANESPAHVINHCHVHSVASNKRHNDIQDRLIKAIPCTKEVLSVNRSLEDIDSTLRPDILVKNADGSLILLDVTCPFEDGEDAFDKARAFKISKYQPLIDALAARGTSATVEAFVPSVDGMRAMSGSCVPWTFHQNIQN